MYFKVTAGGFGLIYLKYFLLKAPAKVNFPYLAAVHHPEFCQHNSASHIRTEVDSEL